MARLKGSWFYGGLPGGTKLLRHHRLLEGLADHLANHLLPDTDAKTLLHDLHGNFTRPESWQSHIRAASRRRLATAPSTRSAGTPMVRRRSSQWFQ